MRRDRFWHDLFRACGEAWFYRKTVLDPPPWPRFRLFLPIRKAKR